MNWEKFRRVVCVVLGRLAKEYRVPEEWMEITVSEKGRGGTKEYQVRLAVRVNQTTSKDQTNYFSQAYMRAVVNPESYLETVFRDYFREVSRTLFPLPA